jgi:hypothetical protein
METWEYLVVYIQARDLDASARAVDAHADADKYSEQLNKYAAGGWELFTFEWDGDKGARAVFKRPRR